MIRSRVFVSLAIALFLADCLSAAAANGTADDKDEKTATERVNALKELTATVLRKAEKQFREAGNTISTVQSQKNKADSAESDVRAAATQITAKERKAEALVIAQKAKEELDACHKLYEAAKEKAETATNSLSAFVASARDLDNKAEIDIQADTGKSDEYTKVIASAAEFSSQTTTLSGQIDKSKVLNTASIALFALKDGAKKVQVLKYQAESLLIVSNIEAKLKTAETDILSIEQKKEEIEIIVQDINTKSKSATEVSSSLLSSLCTNAESQLRIAKSKVTEANNCNTDMQGKKTQLDGDLAALLATDDESKANTQATTVKWHEGRINVEIEKIKGALGAAETSLRNAKNVQQQLNNEMDKHKSQSGTKLNEDKQQDNVPTEEVTTPIRNAEEQTPVIPDTEKPTVTKADKPEITNTDKPVIPKTPKPTLTKTDRPAKTETDKPEITETDKPEITETDKAVLGKSEDTMDQTSEQPVDANLDSTEENKSSPLTDKAKQNPKDDNSELLNNDKLRKITKDITNNSLIGGEVPTWSAANDSAVTVFIPLLVIVVMSAALH